MQIIIMHQTITNHDAIGNDIECMYELLKRNHDCRCYAQNRFNTHVEYIDKEDLEKVLVVKDNLVIYHHSVYWKEGEELLEMCKVRIIFRYHNITPPEFFREYNKHHYMQCKLGREQTVDLQKRFPDALWLSDSFFNARDLIYVKHSQVSICAPFNKISQWRRQIPDEAVLEQLIFGTELNLLFVGRVAPNKGHLTLLDIVYRYCVNFDSKIKLRIVGKFDDGLSDYNNKLYAKINEYGLNNQIEFIGEITNQTLSAYYLGSDIFLCASEHEGFCVPIIEAQYFKLPVIAINSSAVPETLGEKQICFPMNINNIAAATRIVGKNQKYKEYIRNIGYENYANRFTFEKVAHGFTEYLSKKVGIEI